MRKNKLPKTLPLPHLAFLATILIWSAAGPVIKYTLQYIPPFTFLFLRLLLVCIIILPYAFIEFHKHKIHKDDIFNFVLLGIFSQTGLVLIFLGLKYTTALDSAIIGIMGSVLAVSAGHYFYKENVGKKIKLGLLIASIGTLIVVLEPLLAGTSNHTTTGQRVFGNILVFAYSLVWIVYLIWSKMSMGKNSKLLKKTLSFIHIKPMKMTYSPTLIVIFSFYIGLITLVPLAIIENIFTSQSFNITRIDPKGVMGLMYMVIFSSIAAYLLNQWALGKAKIADYAIYNYLGPIFTLPIAYVLLREVPNQFMIIGGIVIFIGVILAESEG